MQYDEFLKRLTESLSRVAASEIASYLANREIDSKKAEKERDALLSERKTGPSGPSMGQLQREAKVQHELYSMCADINTDMRSMMRILGISDHARPYSPHEVMVQEVIPAIETLKRERDALRTRLDAEMQNLNRRVNENLTLREEIDRLHVEVNPFKKECDGLRDKLDAMTKGIKQWQEAFERSCEDNRCMRTRAEKAEAELAAVKPVLDATVKLTQLSVLDKEAIEPLNIVNDYAKRVRART